MKAKPTHISATPAAEYFADYSSVSQSMLKVFADRRRLYDAYYISRFAPEPSPTDPMRKGTALHTALLEPAKFDAVVEVWPDGFLSDDGGVRSNAAKQYRDEAQVRGVTLLKDAEYYAVKKMAESVKHVCGMWLELPSRKEQSVYWENELTGLPCKMRLDWLVLGQRPVIFDLKSTADAAPTPFRNTIERQKYWLQHAQYIEGVEAATGETPLFYFLAVESSFPFACAIHELDQDSAERANHRRNEHLTNLARCLEKGDFREPWEQRINTLPLRHFCFESNYQEENVS